ncbi:MAG: AMP-binding protein [Oscillospiraceae bacterium]|nr:AMP-binding protein [Oscillospiraceae bacterium]
MFVLDSIKKYARTDKTALINRGEKLSYAQLDAYSGAFADWLVRHYGGRGAPVMIYGAKETEFLPCVFGALKAGRAYVPVDTSVPPERAREIAEDISPDVIVDFSGKGFGGKARVIGIDCLRDILRRPCEGTAENPIRGDEDAYILYTSGSTGSPKGVRVTCANLQSFYEGLDYCKKSGGVILNQVSYSFDVSCCSVYAGISRGMTLFTIDRDTDMREMFAGLAGSGLTHWVSTPSFAEMCVRSKTFSSELLPNLEEFLFCGEVLTNSLCNQLAERFPSVRIINTYGPTEATVLVTSVKITKEMRDAPRPLPIGCPIKGTELRIEGGEGESGELLILGESVGPGYFNRPDLTEERFFTDSKTGKRGYRTGDSAYSENGLYYFLGRADGQIKLSGHRIEIGDIENNLARLENIQRAAVIPVYEDGRAQYLTAFVLLKEEDGLSALERTIAVKKQAASFLPEYMIPRKFIAVDAFPLNTNGKLDRKELENRLRGKR